MKSWGVLVFILGSLGGPALADVTLVGNVPNLDSRHLQENLNQIWQHEKATYLYSPNAQALVPPEIGFYAFDGAKQDPNWQPWEKQLIDQHADTSVSFPATVYAFHYAHTNLIQINPLPTFMRFYTNDAYGNKSDSVGFGFYVASHEMLHYVLENDGIPGELHHCLFISEKNGHSLMGDMTQYLVDQKISSWLVEKIGLESEKALMPCEQLKPEELEQVQKILAESPLWN